MSEYEKWHHGSDCKSCGRDHCCYFCSPECYPPMPQGKTLCARCGVMIDSLSDDPMNDEMLVCGRCDRDLDTDATAK